jgi:hypothetical protein
MLNVFLETTREAEGFRLPYFYPGSVIVLKQSSVIGTVEVKYSGQRGITHNGLKMSIVGQVRNKSDGHLFQICNFGFDIAPAGQITQDSRFSVNVKAPDFLVPSYYGTFYDCRYLVIFEFSKSSIPLRREVPVYVLFVTSPPRRVTPWTLCELCLEGLLHLEFIMRDFFMDVGQCVIGCMRCVLAKVRIAKIYFQISRIETLSTKIVTGSQESIIMEHEIMDGSVENNCIVPFRFFMGGMKLWPYPDVRYSQLMVEYKVGFCAVDEDGAKYFQKMKEPFVRMRKCG